MKKFILLFFLSCFLILSKQSSAQASLGISQYTYVIANDTVAAYSATDSIGFYVVNKGTAAFNDVFKVYMAVHDSSGVSFHNVDTAYYLFPVFIAPGDSTPFSIHPYYFIGDSVTQYHYDINVIVIWPVASTASTYDSLAFNIVILLPAAVEEIDLTKFIKAYPNPTTDKLIIEEKGKNAIEEVRIYDSEGRLVQIIHNESIINTESWCKGLYIIDVITANGKQQRLKILKQ